MTRNPQLRGVPVINSDPLGNQRHVSPMSTVAPPLASFAPPLTTDYAFESADPKVNSQNDKFENNCVDNGMPPNNWRPWDESATSQHCRASHGKIQLKPMDGNDNLIVSPDSTTNLASRAQQTTRDDNCVKLMATTVMKEKLNAVADSCRDQCPRVAERETKNQNGPKRISNNQLECTLSSICSSTEHFPPQALLANEKRTTKAIKRGDAGDNENWKSEKLIESKYADKHADSHNGATKSGDGKSSSREDGNFCCPTCGNRDNCDTRQLTLCQQQQSVQVVAKVIQAETSSTSAEFANKISKVGAISPLSPVHDCYNFITSCNNKSGESGRRENDDEGTSSCHFEQCQLGRDRWDPADDNSCKLEAGCSDEDNLNHDKAASNLLTNRKIVVQPENFCSSSDESSDSGITSNDDDNVDFKPYSDEAEGIDTDDESWLEYWEYKAGRMSDEKAITSKRGRNGDVNGNGGDSMVNGGDFCKMPVMRTTDDTNDPFLMHDCD